MDRGDRIRLPVLGALACSAVLLIVLGGRPSGDIRIVEVDAHSESGLIHSIDVELTANAGLEEEQLIFTVMWAGFPHRWIVQDRVVGTSGIGGKYHLTPERPEAVPPMQRTGGGNVRPTPFRVRVNVTGQSEYVVSDVMHLPPQEGSLINSDFQTWSTSAATSPRGWLRANREAVGATVELRPLQAGRGLTTKVGHTGVTDRGWIEAALYQSLASLAPCYEVRLSASHGYSRNENGDIVAAAGVQVLQGTHSVWWVASTVGDREATVLGSTVIVEVPIEPTEFTTATLRIGGEPALGLRVGAEAVLKVFNAMHESENEPRSASFELIRPVVCA